MTKVSLDKKSNLQDGRPHDATKSSSHDKKTNKARRQLYGSQRSSQHSLQHDRKCCWLSPDDFNDSWDEDDAWNDLDEEVDYDFDCDGYEAYADSLNAFMREQDLIYKDDHCCQW